MKLVLILLLCFCVKSFCGPSRCFLSDLHNIGDVPLVGYTKSEELSLVQGHRECTFDDYQPHMLVDTTEHFKYLYTYIGAHRLRGNDSLEQVAYLNKIKEVAENAYDFYADSLGMEISNGVPGVFFSNSDFANKYTIEILDIFQVRSATYNINGSNGPYFGVVSSPNRIRDTSIMLLENDFLYAKSYNVDFLMNGADTVCYFRDAQDTIITSTNYFVNNYNTDWEKALEVTVSHEIYHTFQLHYSDLSNIHFWFEASATAMEDILAPQVNDYIAYMPFFFNRPELPFYDYSYQLSILPRYLMNRFGVGIEKGLWENFATAEDASELVKNTVENSYETSWVSFYSDFTSSLLNSGSHYVAYDSIVFNEDQNMWPEYNTYNVATDTSNKQSIFRDGFAIYDISDLNINNQLVLEVDDSIGVSAYLVEFGDDQLVKHEVSSNFRLQGHSFAESYFLLVLNSDSTTKSINVYSDMSNPDLFSNRITNVYPNPFIPGSHNGVCFSYDKLDDGEVVHIFNSNNVIVKSLQKSTGSNETLCWDGRNNNNALIKPGAYFFKAKISGSQGKILVIK